MNGYLQFPAEKTVSGEGISRVVSGESYPKYLTVSQFCELAQLSRSAVYTYIRRKLLLATKLPGGDLRISPENAAAFLTASQSSDGSARKTSGSSVDFPISPSRGVPQALQLAIRKRDLLRAARIQLKSTTPTS